ncbi:MAG: nuclear transport factor 2 family protein [bacterium]|nr:nuclear transport factor 2 family protein [bacterium]
MPTEDRVQQFLGLVKSGQTIDALRNFYTDDALQQENQQSPRRGIAELIKHEERMLASFERVQFQPTSVLIDGDRVAIRYIFSGTSRGREIRQDEVALQRWTGDRIAEEYFYYDPGQTRRSKST